MSKKVYLSGPKVLSATVTESGIPVTPDWKSYAASTLIKSGITVANPLELDLSGFITSVAESSTAIKHSLELIDASDSILANLFQITESATMEVFYAHRQGKKVIVIGNEPFSSWVMFHSEIRFQSLKDAIDYIVSQPAIFNTIQWSTQFETILQRKSEQYPPTGEHDFEYYGGTVPILVIAPHATSYFMDGQYSPSESYTGAISTLLHRLSGCHALISSYCSLADPVFYLNSPFVSFLTQLLKKISFKLVLVLHGAEDWNEPSSLTLTSWNNASLVNKFEYLNLLGSILKVKDFQGVAYDAANIVSEKRKTMCHLLFEDLKVPVIRMEIHKRYRMPQLQPSLYTNLYTALAQFALLVGMK